MENPEETARLQKPSHASNALDMVKASKAPADIALFAIVLIGLMAVGKLTIGLLINSVALLSEGLHTFVDLFAAGISYYTVRAAARPADYDHRYGHGKIENVAGVTQAAFIFVPTLIIIYRAVIGLMNLDTVLQHGGLDIGTGIMGLTILVNILLAVRLMKVAKQFKSEAIRAAAYHQLNDLWTSIGVFVALGLIWAFPSMKILDPLVAIGVTVISFYMTWSLLKVSVEALLDKSAGAATDKIVLNIIEKRKPLIRGYHNLRTRQAGATVYVDLHVEVCGELSFRDAHDVIEEVEAEIAKALGLSDVIIHADPCIEDCDDCELYQG